MPKTSIIYPSQKNPTGPKNPPADSSNSTPQPHASTENEAGRSDAEILQEAQSIGGEGVGGEFAGGPTQPAFDPRAGAQFALLMITTLRESIGVSEPLPEACQSLFEKAYMDLGAKYGDPLARFGPELAGVAAVLWIVKDTRDKMPKELTPEPEKAPSKYTEPVAETKIPQPKDESCRES